MDCWGAHYAGESGYRRWPNEELVRFMSTQPVGGRWLEAGCGGGGNLPAMRQKGREVVGLDAFLPALQVASIGHSQVVSGDIFNLPFADGTFDGVIDSMVSQHVRSDQHMPLYRESRRVLKPSGKLWVYHLDCGTDCRTMNIADGGDAYEWTNLSLFPTVPFFSLPRPQVLVYWLNKAGFTVPSYPCRLTRRYSDGQVASYTIAEAVATSF